MIDWEKYGFKEDLEYKGIYAYEDFDDLPFLLNEKDGFITLFSDGLEYTFSEGKIPATNQSVVLLLKAFAVKREKT